MSADALVARSLPAPHVALVLFDVGITRMGIEAHHIMGLTDYPTASRTIRADTLLLGARDAASPHHWLTLKDSHGLWQLGVSGNVVLSRFATTALYPLPPLLAARHVSPALCGLALVNSSSLLLYDGAALAPTLTTQP